LDCVITKKEVGSFYGFPKKINNLKDIKEAINSDKLYNFGG